MYSINKFVSAKKPEVAETILLDEIISIIQNGDNNLNLIQAARTEMKGSDRYNFIKTMLLPSFRFNFLLKDYAKNENIIKATGLIYLDVDNTDFIPESELILAKWRSLSNTGFGILVKVDNISIGNFKDVYGQISNVLGISTDLHACKPIQQTILSYDPEVYYNTSSKIFKYNERKVSGVVIKEKKECMLRYESFPSDKIRFDNINDYFLSNDRPYEVFPDKIKICQPFIPKMINEGQRNVRMFYNLSQYALLNPSAGKAFLIKISETLNKKMTSRLSQKEIFGIINSVLKKLEEGTLEMILNKERRILFNPNVYMTRSEKMTIVNQELGHMKSLKTFEKIKAIVENWDFQALGKITQRKVSVLSDFSSATIKRHWYSVKSLIEI